MARYGKRVFVLGMQGLLYHCIACILYNIFSEKTLRMNLSLLLLYFPLCIFALIREKCTNFFVFILFHIATCGISLLIISDKELLIVMSACILIMAIWSIRLRTKPVYSREECPGASSVVLFLLVYVFAQGMHRPAVMQISYYEAFLFLILYVIHRSIKNTAAFLKANEGIENMPSMEIRRMSKMLLAVFVLFLIAGMVLLQYIPIDQMFVGIGRIIRFIVRGVISLIIWLLSGEEKMVEESLPAENGTLPPLEQGEASMFFKVLENIIIAVFYIGLAIAAVYLIGRLFYELYVRFYNQKKTNGDESEFLWENPFVKERVQKTRKKQEDWTEGSSDKKIRSMYKKYIRHKFGKKAVIPRVLTPEELENMQVGQECGPDIEQMHQSGFALNNKLRQKNMEIECERIQKDIEYDGRRLQNTVSDYEWKQQRITLYEKARYSKSGCSRQDVEVMKRNLRMKS